jgi:hypothetical protein
MYGKFNKESASMKKGMLFFTVIVFALTACNVPLTSPVTLTPTNVVVPTSTATPTPMPTLTPSPVPDGPCDNPLVPLRVGNQWKYRATTANGETTYTLKSLERQDTSKIIIVLVELANQKSGETVTESVVCRDGAIENFPLFAVDMLFADYLQKFFNTYHEKGDYAPAYMSFAEKNWALKWKANYLTEDKAYVNDPAGNANLVVLESSPMDLSFQTDGIREAVTVPAGIFPQAIKIQHNFSMTVTILSPAGAVGGILTMNTTQWYEPYVGLVRAQVDSASVKSSMQEFNAPFQNVLELAEFTPGK